MRSETKLESIWNCLLGDRWSFETFCQLFQVQTQTWFARFALRLCSIQVVYLYFIPISLNLFTRSIHFIILPHNLVTNSIFCPYSKSILLISSKITLIDWGQCLLPAKTIFLILLPITRIVISGLLILKHSPSAFCVILPLTKINIPCLRIFSHPNQCPHPFFLKTYIFWSIFKYFFVEYKWTMIFRIFFKIS